MSPQVATAVQPASVPVPVKQSATGDVFDRIQQTYDEIARRAFEIFDNNGRRGNDLEDWFRAESELLHPVHLEIAESDANLTVHAEVPGFSTKELEINVEPRRLTIAGKHEAQEESKKGKKGKTIYSERCAKEILRVVDLPADVDSSKVSAILKDGILNIELPKAAHAKAVRTEPKTA
jgi:HSP20 family protein